MLIPLWWMKMQSQAIIKGIFTFFTAKNYSGPRDGAAFLRAFDTTVESAEGRNV